MKRKDGKFVVIKEKTGYTLNMNETFANFKKAVEAEKHQFELDVVKKKAKYTSKDMAEIKDVLGTYTTEYGGSPYGRKVNVANGASKINGSMVYPGETLSVYKPYHHLQKKMDMHSQVPMKMDRRFRHMVVESARYLLLCIMQLSVQN